MFALHLSCRPKDVDRLSGELWDAGTCGVQEIDQSDQEVLVIARFETNAQRSSLLEAFRPYKPTWTAEIDTDWVRQTKESWPGRRIGSRIFLAPTWCEENTPSGRIRVVHNPGLACGTGEHPCTRLALEALETLITPGSSVVDVGTGSGVLAIAALHLGATIAVGVDTDEEALQTARENFQLNRLAPLLMAGSVDCLATQAVDVVVANISATVLLSFADELLRVKKPGGSLILTGFPVTEAARLQQLFQSEEMRADDGWCCLISRASQMFSEV